MRRAEDPSGHAAARSPGTLAGLARWARRWWTLPPDERRVHAGRVIERLFRRDPAVRRLGLIRDEPRRASLRRALRVGPGDWVPRFRRPDPRRGPLHGDLTARARRVALARPAHADAVLARAGDLLERRFDLLGSGPVRPLRDDGGIDWHRDFKSGAGWDPGTFHLDVLTVRGDGSDVKVPWELSRFQHLCVLGQAYLLARERLSRSDADDLRRRCALETRDQIDDWIERNPRGLGVNWACTMDVAIRAYTWLAALALMRDAPELDDGFFLRVLRSLWIHGRHVRRHLEIGADGLTSNHFLADVVGLYALGCALPELREAREWRSLAWSALVAEMDRQVHDDGVDFERSIPYHRLVTEMFVHATLWARAAGDDPPAAFLARLVRMLEFTAAYTRPDGSAPQWGDNDDGRLLPLDGYATHEPHDHRHVLCLGGTLLGRPDLAAAGSGREVESLWLVEPAAADPPGGAGIPSSRGFVHGGYYVLRHADLHLGVPCGPVGTRGTGNHSHNDLLSVCAWAGGREWVTDPGTGGYTADPGLRNRLRSTRSHATVQVGAREQNPFGASVEDLFSMGGRARPEVLEWSVDDDGAVLCARHRGFGGDGIEHRREIRFLPGLRAWVLTDTVDREGAASDETVAARFPLSPGIDAETGSPEGSWPEAVSTALTRAGGADGDGRARRGVELRDAKGRRFWIVLDLPSGSEVTIESAPYSPRYGVTVAGRVVLATLSAGKRARAVTVLHSPRSAG